MEKIPGDFGKSQEKIIARKKLSRIFLTQDENLDLLRSSAVDCEADQTYMRFKAVWQLS